MECEDEFTDCNHSIQVDYEEIFTARHHHPGSHPKFHIHFIFSCKPFIRNWVLPEHARYPLFEGYVNLPQIDSSVIVNLDEFISQEPARKTLEDFLLQWPVNNDRRTDFINYAMLKAQEAIINMPMQHNIVVLEFQVTAIHRHIYDEWAAVETIRNMYGDGNDDDDDYEDWMEDNNRYMIPTLDSSIDSLETKIVTDDVTCTICLEEVSSEGVSIGCLHIFHEDCIKTWLRNSHYCPVCRFEMPIAS